MILKFKTKENRSIQKFDNVDNLYEFLIQNQKYLRLVMDIMSKNKSVIKKSKVKNIIERNLMFKSSHVEECDNYNEFIDLMASFYDVESKDILNTQRGLLLEKLWDYNGPYYYNKNNYKTIYEAQVFLEDDYLCNYENDIDIVYEIADSEFKKEESFEEHLKLIELDECKASAENTTKSPMDPQNKRKFELMQKTKQKLLEESLSCYAHIITYDGNSKTTKSYLKHEGLDQIEVICRKQIIDRILKKDYV